MTRENIKENRQIYGELKIRKSKTLEKNFLNKFVYTKKCRSVNCHILSGVTIIEKKISEIFFQTLKEITRYKIVIYKYILLSICFSNCI